MSMADIGPRPQAFNLETETLENPNYRTVAWSAGDDLAGLEDALNEHLDDVSVRIVGCVALFAGAARAR